MESAPAITLLSVTLISTLLIIIIIIKTGTGTLFNALAQCVVLQCCVWLRLQSTDMGDKHCRVVHVAWRVLNSVFTHCLQYTFHYIWRQVKWRQISIEVKFSIRQ